MDSTANPGLVRLNSVGSWEYLTIHAFDGRDVTRVSIGTQTDWSHETECSQENQKSSDKGSTSRQSELETSLDKGALDSLGTEDPHAPKGDQGETEESNADMIGPAGKKIYCVTCLLQKKPRKDSKQIEDHEEDKPEEDSREEETKEVDKRQYCRCETWTLSELILKGEVVITEELAEDMKLQKDQRKNKKLKGGKGGKPEKSRTPKAEQAAAKPKPAITAEDVATPVEDDSPDSDELEPYNIFSLRKENAPDMGTTPLIQKYKNGRLLSVIFPDGTGQVYYQSGRVAIMVCTEESVAWSCAMVLEDKRGQHRPKALFSTRGESACYHNNGFIRMNLTPWGGTCSSETGELKDQWTWLGKRSGPPLPNKPLVLTVSPNVDICVKSQEDILITFTYGEQSLKLNVGVKLKLKKGRSLLMLPGQDLIRAYHQTKSAEISDLLQGLQSLTADHKAINLWEVRPKHRLVAQMERRRLPTKKPSAKKAPKRH